MPAFSAWALAITGFCAVEVKALGPVHVYVAPATVPAVRFRVCPAHKGPLLDNVGAAGAGGFAIVAGPAAVEVQPLRVIVIPV